MSGWALEDAREEIREVSGIERLPEAIDWLIKCNIELRERELSQPARTFTPSPVGMLFARRRR